MTGPLSPGVRRVVAAIDTERYSRHPHPVQYALQQRLFTVLHTALDRAPISRRRVEEQDQGDGRLLLLPPAIDESRVVPAFLRGLLDALERDRLAGLDRPALRLRIAMGQGLVHRGATGYVGRAVVDVSRLVDAEAVRAELRAVPDADLCLVVSDELYRDVIAQGYGGFPADGFRVIRVRDDAKEFDATAWLRALNVAALGPDTAVLAATTAVAFPLGAVAVGTGQMIEAQLAAQDLAPEQDPPDTDLDLVDHHDDGADHDDGTEDPMPTADVDHGGDHHGGSP